ncbi:NAD(P)/FAD-dependent oxidoreductase [Alteribacter natronophilus]|uniref:NAD(P)/FAD-dependent oxidoreductase n=1 Tax=Alteribacter natronophilus TaxID=2583810 RepID=UPI00110D466C|nr:NAD(P)/FAD-dependent oxidoreductase [Alteribacter natronophilus]TMW72812.1 NAD(P)/FAD-dependent oxidoreductase [Alteribacter natronophilus]
MSDVYDVTIIGGGPAGLYSAFYSGLRGMKTKIIEVQPELGGKVRLYPEKIIWDVGGQPPISGEKFRSQLVDQGLRFSPTVLLNTKVTGFDKKEDGLFAITTDDREVQLSKTVIMAVGSGIITPQKLPLEGAERFELTNLHYTVQSLERFRGKRVLISGGGNAAVDWANELEPLAEQVYLTHRRDNLSGHEAEVERLLGSRVRCFFGASICELRSGTEAGRIDCVALEDGACTRWAELEVDEVIISHGYERDAGLIESAGLSLEVAGDGVIDGGADSSTHMPGVFAAGDILRHEGKLNLIAGAFHDAANAVNRAKQFIEPEAGRHAMVSSHNERFKEWNGKLKEAEQAGGI